MRAVMLLVTAAAVAALGQQPQPRIENGRLEARALAGSLDSTMRAFLASQSAPGWAGYAVPMLPGDHSACGWDGRHTSSHHLSLEGPSTLFVLYRVEQNHIDKVKIATPDCDIDAGGLTVTWLNGVDPAESVRYLQSLIGQDRLSDQAVIALALHKDAAADRALETMLGPAQPDKVREKAVMWLAITRGRYERVVQVAHQDPSAHVRGQALFWLAQGAQKKLAADTIAGAIQNDPETEVKKKAVFALTQIPNGEGVPRLIDVVKSNHNPEVRKQAIFWLGQSKDPRALEFIEQILVR